LWCCYRLLHLRLPVPTIVITVITIVNILTGLHRLQSESNTQRRDHPRSRLSLLCITNEARPLSLSDTLVMIEMTGENAAGYS
jgi:hypothetical protein